MAEIGIFFCVHQCSLCDEGDKYLFGLNNILQCLFTDVIKVKKEILESDETLMNFVIEAQAANVRLEEEAKGIHLFTYACLVFLYEGSPIGLMKYLVVK